MSPVSYSGTAAASGGGPNPTDAFSLGITAADSNAVPVDAMSVAFTFPDSNATPTDLARLGLTYADTNPTLSDLLTQLGLGAADTVALPTDATAFVLNLAQSDSNATPTDATSLNIVGLGDTNAAPTDTRSGLVKLWGSGSAGTSHVTNPANANGSNDGTTATMQTAAAGATTETLTSNCGNAAAAGTAFTTVVFRGWYKLNTTLATSTAKVVIHSSSAAFADITVETLSATSTTNDHLTTPFSLDVSATINTLVKLQSAQILYSTTDAIAGTSPAVVTVDAGSLELSGAI